MSYSLIDMVMTRAHKLGEIKNPAALLDLNCIQADERHLALAHFVLDDLISRLPQESSETKYRELAGLRMAGLVLAGLISSDEANDALEHKLDWAVTCSVVV